jgi:type IV pilus assembly protein PilA
MHSLRQRLNARDESGFTLIELLVVLIIIGVLLAIAIPSYLGFQKKAQQTAAQSDVRQAIPDAEAYYSDYGNYNFDHLADGTTTGVTAVTALQSYDQGLSSAIATDGTVKGNATQYCISALVSGNWAHVIGPNGTTGATAGVVADKTATADPCASFS